MISGKKYPHIVDQLLLFNFATADEQSLAYLLKNIKYFRFVSGMSNYYFFDKSTISFQSQAAIRKMGH